MSFAKSSKGAIFIAALIVVFLFFGSFLIGQYPIDPSGVVDIIGSGIFGYESNQSSMAQSIVWKVRLPRILAALIVGAALSIAGAVYQSLFKNPMVSPDILGATSGAGFGAAISILLSLPYIFIQTNAFIVGLLAVALTYGICVKVSRGKDALLMLILGGMIVSTLFSSFTTIIKYVADPDSKLPEITYWLMGSLSTVNMRDVGFLLLPLLIGIIPIVALRWQLNAMAFGDEEAKSMGLNVNALRAIFIFCSTLLASASVAVAGMVGWVGLIIPHMARFIVGPNSNELLPMSLLTGGGFLLIVDNFCRNLFTVELPLGILTSLIGAPFFFYLLYIRARKNER
ncbi:MAG: iron ABC transporter permease [Coriobacteriia bacterium]|nr:iron ABC transporter permease [Coriobacteriia bacterium]